MVKIRLWFIFVLFFSVWAKAFSQIGFPYCETFTSGSTQESTVFGADAQLVDGVLRLTSNQTNQRGYVYIDIPFSSVFGIKASFEYFSYGGNGADGLTLFLFDAETPVFNPGGFGGSLGYAQRSNERGLSNAYLGIGFDEFGNFGNSSEGRNGGFLGVGETRVPDAIVIRGPGSGSTGYPFVVGRRTMATGNDGLRPDNQFPISSGGPGTSRVTDRNLPGYRKVFLDLQPNTVGTGFFLQVLMEVTTRVNEPMLITIFDRPYDFPAPKNLKIGFSASTGGQTNFHEIRNLLVEVSNDEALEEPKGVDFEDKASCEGQENTYFITDEEVVLPNPNSVIRCLQFYGSLEDIEAETGDVCSQGRCKEENRELILPKGTFRAGSDGGDFTFFPNLGFRDQEVTVYYTITDTYGKTSAGNAMTLLIQESPDPVKLLLENETSLVEEIRLCAGEEIKLEATGEEVYERFEWYKDGELITGATTSTYQVNSGGEYEVRVYNRKNCPSISNSVKVEYPAYPSGIIQNPTVGCTPGQTVDVTISISGYDTEKYDYQLSGLGKVWLNDEMKSISQTGNYELKIKEKDLDCYSEPFPVEVIILTKILEVDFEFEVQGTGITGDADGGIFPDDVIQFSDLSDEEAVSWSWNFGDGSSSTDQNPAHVFGKRGEYEIELIINNELGCESRITKMVSITRSYRLMIPTGFTPTLEENKTFIPKYKGLTEIELLIFNTWGELIFKTADLNTIGWDGTLEGKLLDAGVFVYRFDGTSTDGEKISEAGKFNLIR